MKINCPHCRGDIEVSLSVSKAVPEEDGLPPGVTIRPALRLVEVSRQIRESGLLKKPPCRQTLINMLRAGLSRASSLGLAGSFGKIPFADGYGNLNRLSWPHK